MRERGERPQWGAVSGAQLLLAQEMNAAGLDQRISTRLTRFFDA